MSVTKPQDEVIVAKNVMARTRFTDFSLHPGGRLATDTPSAGEAASRFAFDPRRPIPTIGGNISSLVGLLPRPAGAAEIPVEDRECDVKPHPSPGT